MPKPFSPLAITRFLGENDVIPATEMEDAQCSLAQNLYLVQGGLERRLGTAAVNTSLGSSKAMQGMLWCKLDSGLAGAGYDAADGGVSGVLLDPLDSTVSAALELYLRSDQVAGADGSAVATWPDLSAYGRTGTQGTAGFKPILRLTGTNISPNGRAMVQFDGVDDQITGSFPVAGVGGIPNTNGYTYYCYHKLLATGDAQGQTFFASTSAELASETNAFNGWSANGQYGLYGRTPVNKGTYGRLYGTAATGYQLLSARFNPPAVDADATNAMEMWKNSGALTPDAATTNMRWNIRMDTTWYVGDRGTNNNTVNATVGAMLVYSTAHNNATRSAIERWLLNFFEG